MNQGPWSRQYLQGCSKSVLSSSPMASSSACFPPLRTHPKPPPSSSKILTMESVISKLTAYKKTTPPLPLPLLLPIIPPSPPPQLLLPFLPSPLSPHPS